MQCINKLKAGFHRSGKGLAFSPKEMSKELSTFDFECRKCLPCRLNIAREKSIRALHEAKMHENNIFLTLTYDNEHLTSPKLQYKEFQLFMYKLREQHTRHIKDPDLKKEMTISYMVTGEYGEQNKRPHWHAIIFNYSPADKAPRHGPEYRTSLGHQVFTSELLSKLWGRGSIEFGSVTIESAGYVARYSTKKLQHGNDQDHEYDPIHKTSSRRAIGRPWIEKYWQHTFDNGFVYLPNGSKAKIPRYYVDWLKKHHPERWKKYVTTVRQELQEKAQAKARKEELDYLSNLLAQQPGQPRPITRKKVLLTILNQKFKKLNERLKL